MAPPTAIQPRSDAARVAGWFHALADEARVQIVEMLSHKERCVCELEQVLGIAQSRLSFHLKVLKDARLVTEYREGTRRFLARAVEQLRSIAPSGV